MDKGKPPYRSGRAGSCRAAATAFAAAQPGHYPTCLVPLLLTCACHLRSLAACSWFFVAGEREAITKEVTKLANKVGLDL